MRFYEHLLVFVAVFFHATCYDLPSTFTKCKCDESISECLEAAVQDALPKLAKGIPDLDFPPLEPLHIPALKIGAGKQSVHVVQHYKNIDIYGMSEAIIEQIKATITPTSAVIDINSTITELKMNADYRMNGRMLIFPIVGRGKCTVLLKDVKARMVLSGETVEEKGQTHLEIKDLKVTLQPEKVEFNFENLFGGLNAVLNENSKDVFEDVRFGYEEAIALICKNIINRLFRKISYTDLFLP